MHWDFQRNRKHEFRSLGIIPPKSGGKYSYLMKFFYHNPTIQRALIGFSSFILFMWRRWINDCNKRNCETVAGCFLLVHPLSSLCLVSSHSCVWKHGMKEKRQNFIWLCLYLINKDNSLRYIVLLYCSKMEIHVSLFCSHAYHYINHPWMDDRNNNNK
jgi:hypothetical protein